MSYSSDGGVAAAYRLPKEVSAKHFTETIGFRIYRSRVAVKDVVDGFESAREFDAQLTVTASRRDEDSWLVAHSSPLWNEHGIALIVAGANDGFLFYYTNRRAVGFDEAIDRWTRLLLGSHRLEPNQVLEPTGGSVTPAADAPGAPPPPVAHR